MRPLLADSIPATSVLSGSRAGAQAGVNETQGSLLYVDAWLGSGSISVAQSPPVKTVHAAVKNANALNQQGIGVRVIVNAGEYRNYVNLGYDKNISTPLTLQAAVSGSTVVSDFQGLDRMVCSRRNVPARLELGHAGLRRSRRPALQLCVSFADSLAPTDPPRLRDAASAGQPSTGQPPI